MSHLTPPQVLLTGLKRTSEQAAHTVKEMNAEAIIFPLLETVSLTPKTASTYEWVVFTSPAAVEHFFAFKRDISFNNVACVGPSTVNTLKKFSYSCNLIPDQYNSDALIKQFNDLKVKKCKLLYACSALADNTIENGLSQLGHSVDRAEFYKPTPMNKKALPEFSHIVFFSGSGVEAMFELYGKEVLADKVVASIGARTTKRILQLFDLTPLTSKKSTAKDTVQLLLKSSQ